VSSTADIAGVVDDALRTALEPPPGPTFVDFPLDVVFTHDLDEMDLSGIRLVVLMHPIAYTDEWLAKLRRKLPEKCRILWHGVSTARRGEHDFAVESVPMSVDTAREIIEAAGVHCYAPKECTVYADNRVLSFFPREDMSFLCRLKEKATLVDIRSGATYENVDAIKLTIAARDGVAFEVK